MKTVKTDSLGIEILSSISIEETGNAIKPVKRKDEAINNQNENELTLFEVYDQNEVVGYFTLKSQVYDDWVKEYKLEGVEL